LRAGDVGCTQTNGQYNRAELNGLFHGRDHIA
jgi:hypothetical protein